MEFNLPNRKKKDMGIEMGPLMDIVFILLIFFVVTSSFTRETGVDVTKPQAQTASQLEKENLLIAITREGTIHMNERQVDLASLQDILKQSLSKNPDREAVTGSMGSLPLRFGRSRPNGCSLQGTASGSSRCFTHRGATA